MRRPLLLVIIGTVVFCGVLIFGAAYYRHLRNARFLRVAKDTLAKGDMASAMLWADRLVPDASKDSSLARFEADTLEKSGNLRSLSWRGHVVLIEPRRDPKDYLDWASNALIFNRGALADYALGLVPKAERTAPYYELKAIRAIQMHLRDQADVNFAEAVRLEPRNPMYQVNLAALRLEAANDGIVAEARRRLEELSKNPEVRFYCWRALTLDAKRHGQGPLYLELAAKTAQAPRAGFGDQLTLLDAMEVNQSPERTQLLASLEKSAQDVVENIPTLVFWLIAHDQSQEALRWLNSLPPATQKFGAVMLAKADALVARKAWAELKAYLTPLDWGASNYLRAALLARVARETAPNQFDQLWKKAVDSVRNRTETTLLLGELATKWGWQKEADALLWDLADQHVPVYEAQALQDMLETTTRSGEAQKMLRIVREQFRAVPANPVVQNNYAYLCLLLGMNHEEAMRLAVDLHKRFPDDPTVTGTYAFACYRDGEMTEGLATLEKLPVEKLSTNSMAMTYGLLLQANHQPDKARVSLQKALPGSLLDTEQQLVKDAEKL